MAVPVLDVVGLEAEVAPRKADLHSREMTARNLRELAANEASTMNEAIGKNPTKSVAGDLFGRANNALLFTQKLVGQALG